MLLYAGRTGTATGPMRAIFWVGPAREARNAGRQSHKWTLLRAQRAVRDGPRRSRAV